MHSEAISDGIRIDHGNKYSERYYPLCCICGKEVMTYSYRSNKQYTCKQCKLEKALADKETRVEEDYEVKERKFENAVNRVKQVVCFTEDYEIAAGKIHAKLHNSGWFQSTEEIMVAIELVKNKIKSRHQVQFGKYKADFVLPEEKIVLEVDGTPFHNNFTRDKENLRDNLITIALGTEWEVIRISDNLINKNIKELIPALIAVKLERKKVRFQNCGELPNWYTDRVI